MCFVKQCVVKSDLSKLDYKSFYVRKKKVMEALYWLKIHNVLYRDNKSLKID